jgi:beta-ribofuranosylaminobenzene 5'-phosphate synthase
MIRIKTPSRLHLTLIDLNGSIGRVDGGAGITLNEPFIEITAEKSDTITVKGDPELNERMKKACMAIAPGQGISIAIERSYWNHIGLGSGTQGALAAGTAISKLYGLNLTTRDIAFLVGRGGTSGIGIGSFEHGGFILDGGHRMNAKKAFLPSSFSKGILPAPVLMRHDFPGWDIILAIPPAKGAYDVYEKDVFAKLCPIPLGEVEKLSHIILMQMLPAIVERDLDNFGRAINSIQEIGFKKRELDLQPGARELMDIMRSAGAAGAGMTSFGPTVYAFTDSPSKVESAIKKHMPECTVIKTKAKNSGYEIFEE